MGLWEKLKNFVNNLKNKDSKTQKQLPEGSFEIPSETRKDEFVNRIQQTKLSPEMAEMEEKRLAEKAAYNCLAEMVLENRFDDETHLGESKEKSMYRLQVEDYYRNYGHGINVPVSEDTIRVYREIQRNYNELKAMCDDKGADLYQILASNGKTISEEIGHTFEQNKGSFYDFNSDYEITSSIEKMKNAISETLEQYMDENQRDNY